MFLCKKMQFLSIGSQRTNVNTLHYERCSVVYRLTDWPFRIRIRILYLSLAKIVFVPDALCKVG